MTELPPESLFSGDDGAADPNLVRCLSEYGAGVADLAGVVAALETSRVFVAVVAVATETGQSSLTGLTSDRNAEMSLVMIEAPAGHKTLPVFTDIAALARWSEHARPVPVEARRAALSGVDEGCDLIVIDPAGPVRAVLPRPAVWAVAQARRWQPSWADREVCEAVVRRARAVVGVVDASCQAGARAELRVLLRVTPGLDRDGLDEVTGAVSRALAAEDLVADRVDSIELTVTRA